jgi:hypothetical protein
MMLFAERGELDLDHLDSFFVVDFEGWCLLGQRICHKRLSKKVNHFNSFFIIKLSLVSKETKF